MLRVKNYDIMVKDLNLQSGGESSNFQTYNLGSACFLTYITYYKFVFSLRWVKLSS
jgi:hypothetical protein